MRKNHPTQLLKDSLTAVLDRMIQKDYETTSWENNLKFHRNSNLEMMETIG